MILNDAIDEIIDNVKTASDELDKERVKEMLQLLTSCNNVFLLGLGRSGLVARAFAMRLMHLGIGVYVVGGDNYSCHRG